MFRISLYGLDTLTLFDVAAQILHVTPYMTENFQGSNAPAHAESTVQFFSLLNMLNPYDVELRNLAYS